MNVKFPSAQNVIRLRESIEPSSLKFVVRYVPKNSWHVSIFKDGTVAVGATKNISVKEMGFYLCHRESENDAPQKFIAFEQTLALRFLDSFEEGWERKYSADCSRPKNRQIVATLLNGEVIEGITPNIFDEHCRRFFVFSTGDDGNSSWSLVESAVWAWRCM